MMHGNIFFLFKSTHFLIKISALIPNGETQRGCFISQIASIIVASSSDKKLAMGKRPALKK